MGDHEDGAPNNQFFQGRHDFQFSFDIQGGGWLIQHEDMGITEKRTRNGEALALSTGEVFALIAHQGTIALRPAHNGVMDVRLLCGFDDFVHSGIGPPYFEVFKEGSLEQYSFLEDHTDILTQEGEWILASVSPIELDYATAHFVETGDQFDERGFPTA